MKIHYDDSLRAEARARLAKSCEDFFGFGLEHLTFTYATWNLSTWKEDDMTEITNNPKNTLKVLDKLWNEIAATDRNTTIRPYETSMTLSIPKARPIQFHAGINNIITTSGLVEMAKRGTDEHSTGTGSTHGAVGKGDGAGGATDEALSDVALESEEDRKAFSTDGVAQVSGTTERYGAPFSVSDLASGAGTQITEAGLFTKSSGGECISHVTANAVTVNTGRIMTLQTDITHANGTTL